MQTVFTVGDKDSDAEKTNMISIVCGNDFELLKNVFVKIGVFLGWDVVEEESDDGEENFVIWSLEK